MKRNVIRPIGLAPVGLAIEINGQRFDLVAHEPFTRHDGAIEMVMVWQAECAVCSTGFRSFTMPGRFAETRRCELHRQPGKPVRSAAA